jgi:hypothetical protein
MVGRARSRATKIAGSREAATLHEETIKLKPTACHSTFVKEKIVTSQPIPLAAVRHGGDTRCLFGWSTNSRPPYCFRRLIDEASKPPHITA